jgi:hypothetical protein
MIALKKRVFSQAEGIQKAHPERATIAEIIGNCGVEFNAIAGGNIN